MHVNSIAAVLVHVSNVEAALRWYLRAFPEARPAASGSSAARSLTLGGVQIEFVPTDAKVTSGAAGSVVYWKSSDFSRDLRHLLACDAKLYRGPMQIEGGLSMCQVRDPWGNCFGLRGSVEPQESAD